MTKIIEFETYNSLDKKNYKRYINAEHIVELQKLPVGNESESLTRIKLVNGDFMDIKTSISDTINQINN